MNAAESDGTTALHYAVYHDDVPLVEGLLEAGARPSVANKYGSTPLLEAAMRGDTVIIESLVKAGADVNAGNTDGQSALMTLARTSNIEAAKILISHGANVNVAGALARADAPHVGGRRGPAWAMVKLLLDHGATDRCALAAESLGSHGHRRAACPAAKSVVD